MRTLGKLACALVLVAFLLGGGLPDGGPGPAAALDSKVVAAEPEAVAFQKDRGDRCIHKLCKELIATEKRARRCLAEESKEKDKRDVKHLRVVIKHLEEAIRE